MGIGNKITHNAQGLLLCWNLYSASPELKPNIITDDEVKNKSSIELRLTEPLTIANKMMRIYSSASIAANPMLAVRSSSPSVVAYFMSETILISVINLFPSSNKSNHGEELLSKFFTSSCPTNFPLFVRK